MFSTFSFGQTKEQDRWQFVSSEVVQAKTLIAMNDMESSTLLSLRKDNQEEASLNTFQPIASQFKLYPNPNNGVFNIDFPDAQELVTVNIIDLLGKQVVKIEYFNTKKVEVNENLKAGVYLVEISAANTSETIRIVVE